ncbi:hypothetical protein N7491_003177 [Penicillium cf. griseofulvum]|uniref:CCHC-type domain-containing protein n=1 Tax=Penicillium cf. griseofulvum TaxID=2972120 RepID=A0A9W9MRM2_9EURO|nr:hypothetical protein N7472_002650 [Penicillium cf. griseofulvum]KAJ5440771.1 hypothetical protein N7491_003177 [Penicillium cf. griseofulvum]KAJ5448818.1 hypothetical protein N7445_003639 [Penicillium cf. griseofulvum]
MANSSDEEADSRTALVGAPRTRSNPRSTSRSASHDSTRPAKRQRRNRNKKDSDLADFVPKGVAFTATSLPVDPDSTSSSGSSSTSSEDSDSDSDANPTTTANPHAGNTAPAISWNQGRKAAVRTTLGKRSAPTNENPTQFEAVNDKYWRSRSDSVASANGEKRLTANDHSENDDELEDGEIDSKSDTDDSDSLGSEADDSILLNIGDKMGMDGANDYNPATLAHQHASNTDHSNLKSASTQSGPGSKEEAFRLFSIKYPSAPTALVDLSQTDLENLAKFVYFDRSIHDLDLRLPISCLECQSEGHMADVCPAKECEHCGAWNQHQSNTCPDWRRCQRCRERGHDEPQCDSKLRSFAYEVPCDYCGDEHLESECDFLWKFPTRDLHSEQVTVSICCANCCSAKHLVADCPAGNLRTSNTSSFTLKGIDPDMITNLNTVVPARETHPPSRSQSRGRAREWPRPPSPDDDDDMMSRVSRGRGRPVPAPRGNTRGNIKFAIGAKRGDAPSRGPSRGRSTFSGNNNRPRSPNPPLPRGPPPRGGGRSRGPQRGGGFSRGPRGGGRGRGW